jgi:hypothetical protein
MAKQTKPILDTKTNKEYPSMYNAGQHLAKLVNGDPTNRLVWFSIQRAFPDRFKTKNGAGEWVALNDPSVPKITRVRRTETDEQKEQRLLSELGAIQAKKAQAGAANGNTAAATAKVSPATKMKTAPRPVAVAEEEEVEDEGDSEEVEEAAPAPTRKKLATSMRQG